jgi:hypothetical protein
MQKKRQAEKESSAGTAADTTKGQDVKSNKKKKSK